MAFPGNVISAQQIAARFIGAGNFSALATQGAVAYQISVQFAGVGNVSADSSKYKLAAATFGGIGNISAADPIVKYAQATFAGDTPRSVGTISRQAASAIFAGQGSMRAELRADAGHARQRALAFPGETTPNSPTKHISSDERSPEKLKKCAG